MGTFIFNAIVVTVDNEQTLWKLHKLAMTWLPKLTSTPVQGQANGFWSFMIAPDGSKLGFPLHFFYEEKREAFIEAVRSEKFDDWLEIYQIEYGETPPTITNLLP